jgi:hypothetical protein
MNRKVVDRVPVITWPASQGQQMAPIQNSRTLEQSIDLADEFDRQVGLAKYSPSVYNIRRSFLAMEKPQLSNDKEAAIFDTLNSMNAFCTKLREEIDEINRSILSTPSSSEILNHFNLLLKADEDIEMNDAQNTPQEKPKSSKFNSPRTPNNLTKNTLDFDAFPQTPTLAQLGISDNTLAIVGEGQVKSRLGHISDTDSEYKISPSCSVALSLVNTIPSTHIPISNYSSFCVLWQTIRLCN